jgi:hypothetical protein
MLFHVTITHSQEDCPGRRPDDIPELIGPADQVAALGEELSVTSHSVVWGAACILWAEPEHVAYALLEAASLHAVERYVEALTPAGWAIRALPVFMLPSQLTAVQQLLGLPAHPLREPPAFVAEPHDDRNAGDIADTLKGVRPPSSESAADQLALPADEAEVDTFPPEPNRVDAHAAAEFPDEPQAYGESPTVILDTKTEGTPGVRLVANTGPCQGSIFEVGEDGATLGRLPDNSICLTDGRLSRHHAHIEYRDGGYWLSDLGSQNGTLVNDHALTAAHLLQAGDSIELGTTRLTVLMDPDD